jgi:putative protease
MTPIELLSPARDAECGVAAIDHGADAVYIGGPSFGARSAAGNAISEIARIASYAHRYRARVYLTLNTILFDDELDAARDLARQAWEAGVDALIVQDMGLLELDLPPLPLIASTQMHNMEPGHIRFLEQSGFQRVILARELSLEKIRTIRRDTTIELEAFVHGSLCVCHSGRCYLSAAMGGRSANRGACGQPCRLPWSLVDSHGRELEKNRHLLSLKDMDRSGLLASLIAAGVTAFKIEGRLKDISYIKNITALYRTRIDAILEERPGLRRASDGRTEIFFEPDPRRTFHRGSTDYFLHGGDDGIWSPDTPKSLGEELGAVTLCGKTWFTLETGMEKINAGDGLCFLDGASELQGLQVVKVSEGRVRVHQPLKGLRPGMSVFRNHDRLFLKGLGGRTSERRIPLDLTLHEIPEGFLLEGRDKDGTRAEASLASAKEPAEKTGAAFDTMRRQLSKLAGTMFSLASIELRTGPFFIRTAELNRLRRDLIAALEVNRLQSYQRPLRVPAPVPTARYPVAELDYSYNVSNAKAREFYRKHGVTAIEPAFELQKPSPGAVLMTARHCVRRSLGACPRRRPHKGLPEDLFIEHGGRRFRLEFDCRNCLMTVRM